MQQKVGRKSKKAAPKKQVQVGTARVPAESLKTAKGVIRAYLKGYSEDFRKLGD